MRIFRREINLLFFKSSVSKLGKSAENLRREIFGHESFRSFEELKIERDSSGFSCLVEDFYI